MRPPSLPHSLSSSPLLYVLLLTALSLYGSLTGCAVSEEERQRALISDPQAQAAGEAALAWMRERVELMVEHKGSCAVMAAHLLEDDRESATQRAQWRKAGAQAWLITRGALDPDFQRELNALITKGDLVFSFCAFFEDFRRRLKG